MNRLNWIGAVFVACLMAFGAGVPAQAASDFMTFDSLTTVSADSPALFDLATPASVDNVVLVAVDNSISTLCQPGADESYSRPGGFCEAVAVNKSMVSGPGSGCPAGTMPNPAPPPKCIPIV